MQETEVPPVSNKPAEVPLDPNEQLWSDPELAEDDVASIRALFAKGVPIYYEEDDTPEGLLIKHYPDGCRELVRFRPGGDKVIATL